MTALKGKAAGPETSAEDEHLVPSGSLLPATLVRIPAGQQEQSDGS